MELTAVRSVWDGDIAGKFLLAQHEVTSLEHPQAYFMMLPRNSYFPLLLDRIHKHFLTYTDKEKEDEIWLDYKGQPIKWHYPIGLLFDLLVLDANMPWEITIHFQDFPNDVLIRCPDLNIAEANYMSSLKEADQIKHRGQVMNNMNKNQHKLLWHSLRSNNFEQFWNVNKILMEGYEGTPYFKSIPIKFYYNNSIHQKLINSRIDEKCQTLEDAIHICLPQLNLDTIKPLVQGIFPPLTSKLQWLSENLSSADNFLHVVLQSV